MRLLVAICLSLIFHLVILKLGSSKREAINSFQVDLFNPTIAEKKSEPVVKKKVGVTTEVSNTGASATVATTENSSSAQTTNLQAETVVVAPPAYPLISKKLGEEGEVVVAIKCEASCQFELTKSSGFQRLDQAFNDYMKKINLNDFKNKKLLFKFVLKD